jgi:plasmid stability protein
MPQLVVRQIDENVVEKLKQRAGEHGVSMEEEHRRILRESLLGKPKRRKTIKHALLAMPNVGQDADFERVRSWSAGPAMSGYLVDTDIQSESVTLCGVLRSSKKRSRRNFSLACSCSEKIRQRIERICCNSPA